MGQCIDYVRNEPEGFDEAYWLINSVIVYANATASNSGTEHSTSFDTGHQA